MYINRNDALKILGKLSREPYYQHSGEDYYVGIAEATGEIASMQSANIENHKENPKKPIGDLGSVPHYRCPNCNNAVVVYLGGHKYPYCQWCGQKLDWDL